MTRRFNFDALDEILKKRGISRRNLALSAGINESTMSTAFARKTTMSDKNIIKIAQYLDIDPRILIDVDAELKFIPANDQFKQIGIVLKACIPIGNDDYTNVFRTVYINVPDDGLNWRVVGETIKED